MAEHIIKTTFDDVAKGPEEQSFIVVTKAEGGEKTISIKGLYLSIPNNGPPLVKDLDLTLEQGDRMMLTGPSGSGKSTLVKAILDLWDSGKGHVTLPADVKIMAVSQKAYFSNTTVRGLLNFPEKEGYFDDEKLTKALQAVGHDKLIQFIPGQQVRIMMDELLAKISKKSKKDKIISLIAPLVRKDFSSIQYVPEAEKTYLREKLAGIFSKKKAESLATDIVQEIDKHLAQPLYDMMCENIALEISKKYYGKIIPYTSGKIGYFSSSLRRKLTKDLQLYMTNADTDEKERDIKFNQAQAEYVIDSVIERIKQEIEEKNASKGKLSALFGSLTWPLSVLWVPRRARKASKDIMQSLGAFMERQIVNGDLLSRQLSGGEQQKLVFARILLHKPDILILDEITAALDMKTGDALYKEMIEKLPDTTIISIAHNTHIMKHHTLHASLDAETKKITVEEIDRKALLSKRQTCTKHLCSNCLP